MRSLSVNKPADQPAIPDDIKIEKGIPIPGKSLTGKNADLLRRMEIGDSFFEAVEPSRMMSRRGNWYTAAKSADRKVSTRAVDGGIRVWRVK